MKIVSSFALCLCVLTSSAYALDTNGNYAVWGAGKKSCFAFQKDLEVEKIDKYKSYMKGFITAYNIFTDNNYSISGKMTETQIIDWLNGFCEDNPMSSFEAALTNFTFDHYDERMKSSKSGSSAASW